MKKKILLIVSLAFLSLYMCSCAGSTPPLYVANYTFSLEKAENYIGNFTTKGMTYSDSCIEISFYPEIYFIKFSVINKLNDAISIVWDDALYIDVNQVNERLINSTIDFKDKDKPQVPTVIRGNGELLNAIMPVSKISKVLHLVTNTGEMYEDWDAEPMFPGYLYTDNPNELRQKASSHIGKTFQILLPVQIIDIKNNYLFTFRIDDVSVEAEKKKY